MNLLPSQIAELAELIRDRAGDLAELIAKGVTATAMHTRPSVVNLILKIARNPDEPRLIEVLAQEKLKSPKSKFSDMTSWDEVDSIAVFRTDEDPSQEHLPGTDRAVADAINGLRDNLKKHGASMTIKSPGGNSVTIGKAE